MNAEPRKTATAPSPAPPAAPPSRNLAWEILTSNSPTATYVWSGVLAVLLILLAITLFNRFNKPVEGVWQQLDIAATYDSVKEFADHNKGTAVGTIARFHQARTLTQDGSNRIGSQIPSDRTDGADKLEQARGLFAELASATREPELIQEALLTQAKLEEWLSSVPQKAEPTKMRGSLDTAQRMYEQLAGKYPESFRGRNAQMRAKELKEQRAEVAKFYEALAREHAAVPVLPPLDPPTLPEAPKASLPEAPKVPTPELPKAATPELPKAAIPEAPKAPAPEAPKPPPPEAPKAPGPDVPKPTPPEAPRAPQP